MKKNKYYQWRNVLSYNALFHFIITERSLGKTYGFLIHRMKMTLYKDSKLLVLTKFKNELDEGYQDEMMKTINEILTNEEVKDFDDIEVEVTKESNHILLNGKIMFTFFAINQAQSMRKITGLKEYDGFWHDEFLTIGQYCHNEVDKILMIWDTIDRNRDRTKAYFTANAMTRYNPYFEALNIPNDVVGFWFNKDSRTVVHVSNDKAYQEQRLKSALTKLAGEDSDYIEMASKGQFSYDNDEYVLDLDKSDLDRHKFGLSINKKRYVASTFFNGIYIHNLIKTNHCYHNKRPTTNSVKMPSKSLKKLKQLYFAGLIYFQNIDIKNNFEKEFIKE